MGLDHQFNLLKNRVDALEKRIDILERKAQVLNSLAVNNANRISKIEERFKMAAKIAAGIKSRKGPQP